ncbi:serine/threonine protein kinase, putative [Plasmodium berghei]|uniref:Aurora kinase n=1 Tax=Plasmodium berghei TaxID=5821 RepID=A0A0Y9UDI1_PLABE|nr:serine/threonine protein kinase, putative [Plasmodium berghei]SCM17325.1 serine/threonine protein kinase, putative [Plasmodium berghei]
MNENIKSHNYLKEKNILNKNPSNLVNADILKFNTNIKKNNNVERFYHDKVSDSSNMYNKNGRHINKSVGAEKNVSGNKTTNLVNIKNNNQRFFSKSENEKCVIRNINMREDNYTTNIIKGKDNDIINNRKNANISNNERLYLKSSDDKLTKNINTSRYEYENILGDNNNNNNGNGIRNDIEKDNNGNNNGYYSYNCKNLKKSKEPNNSLDSFYKRKREMEEETYDKKRINNSLNKDYYYNTYTKTDINDSRMNIKDIKIKDISENISKIKNLQNDILNVKNTEKARSMVHNISESEKKMFNTINHSNNSTEILSLHSFNTNESCNYDKYVKDIFNKNYDYKKIKNPENSYLEAGENIISRSCTIEKEQINNSDDFIRRNFMYDNKFETKINETKSNKFEKNMLTDIKGKNSNEYILKHKKNYNEEKGNNFCDNEFKQNKYDLISYSFNEQEESMNDYISNTDFVKNKNEELNKLIDINKNHQSREDKSEEQNATFTILNKEDNINMETQEYNISHEGRKLLYNNVKNVNEIEFNDDILNDFRMDISKPIDTKNTINLSQEESNIIYKINNSNEDAKKDYLEYDLSYNNCKNQNNRLKKIDALNDIMNTYKHKLVDNTNNVLNKGQNKSDEDDENLLNMKGTESKKDNVLDHKSIINETNLISITSSKKNNNSNVSNVRNVNSDDISSTSSENKKNLIKKSKYNESVSKRLFSTHTLSSNNKCVSNANYLKNNIKTSIKNSFKETYKKNNLDRHKTIGFNRTNTNLDKINSNISRNNGITKNSIQKFPSSNMHTNLSNIQSKKKTIDNTVNNNYKNSAIENTNLEENNEKIKKRQKIECNKTYNNSFVERMKKKNPNEYVDGNKNAFIQKKFQICNNINFEKSKTKMFLSNNKSITNNGYNKNGLSSELAEKKEILKNSDKLSIAKKYEHSGHVEVGTKLERGLGKEIEIGLQGEISINSKLEEKVEVPLYKRNSGGEAFRENVRDTNESNINYNSRSNSNKAKANALNRERANTNKEIRTLPSSNSIPKSGKNTLLVKIQNTNNYMRYGSKVKEIEDNKLKVKSLANNNKGIDNKYASKWGSNKTSSSSNITNNIVGKKNNMLVKKDEINKKKKEIFNQVAKINTNINPGVENKQISLQTKKQHNKIINKDQSSTKNSNNYNNKKCTPNSNINQSTNDTRKINENNTNRNCNKKKNNNNKDIISKEMEKYKYLMKKNKIKSNSIPPGNQKEIEKNANKYECRNNYRSRDDYGCNNKYGRLCKNKQINYDNMLFLKGKKGKCESDNEYPYIVQEVQNQSCYINNNNDIKNDDVLEYLKDKDENTSKNINTSNSLNNGEEQKELSYFEWLAKEQEKKENEMNRNQKINKQDKLYHEKTENERDEDSALNKGVLNKHNDGANYDKMEDNEHEEEDSEDDKENDTNVMLQPLLAFNLKQNEKSYEQNDFIVDKHPIGNGRTGLVFKAIIRKENLQVALKVMAKDTILSLKIERQVLKEIIIQSSLKHINILDLIAYFEDKTRLFLVLEIANGGSIRNKMKLKHDTFKEEQVALYVYQIADALSYLHNFNIIHRDLKPDNILIHYSDSDVYSDENVSKIYKYGIIKIADFGFSCQLKNKRQKRSTFCGTVDYMPPEIINQIPYGCNADLWCLGIVIFELLVGFPPFTDNSQERIFEQIKEFDFHFPKTVSQMARELILRLCSRSSEERISAEEVKSHPWIKQFL